LGCSTTFHKHLALARRDQVIDQLERGGFSRATAAEQDKRFSAPNLQVQSVEELLPSGKSVGDFPEFNDRPVLVGSAHVRDAISRDWMVSVVEKTIVFLMPCSLKAQPELVPAQNLATRRIDTPTAGGL
jgi:hypothetical protein